MKKIVVVGSINMDISLKVNHIPAVGETIISKGMEKSGGGKGANQAMAIAKLGGDVSFIARVGTDDDGNMLYSQLEQSGIKMEAVVKDNNSVTGTAYINVSDEGDNNIVVYPGANFELGIEQIEKYKHLILEADICVVQLEIPIETIEYIVEICKNNNVMLIVNPAPAQALSDKLLKGIDYLIPNETELSLLINEKGTYEELAKKLIKKGVKNVLVTLGSQGCMLVNETDIIKYEAIKVKAVDTTAAGDSFLGGLAVAMAEGKSISEAVSFATRVAACTVMKKGAQVSLPSRVAVEKLVL